jgi:molecular chaperone GrpE
MWGCFVFDNHHFRIYNAVMVNKHNDKTIVEDDIEITNEIPDTTEPELSDVEDNQKDIISSLRKKLKEAEEDKRTAQDDLQRARADFLNARKRLDEERQRDKQRSIVKHVEELLPLCDSFEMAMSNKEVWEKADENWRKGIEGIYAQLQSLLTQYNVTKLIPLGEVFDPHRHEALSMTPVTDKTKHDTVVAVIQNGYEIDADTKELIRPARVAIGVYEEEI